MIKITTNQQLLDNFYIFSSSFSSTLCKLLKNYKNNSLQTTVVSRLTVAIALSITDEMKLLDVTGVEKKLTRHHVHWMMVTGWFSFIMAWILHIFYYMIHPSAVDFHPNRLRRKSSVYILGQNIDIFNMFGNIVICIKAIFNIT